VIFLIFREIWKSTSSKKNDIFDILENFKKVIFLIFREIANRQFPKKVIFLKFPKKVIFLIFREIANRQFPKKVIRVSA